MVNFVARRNIFGDAFKIFEMGAVHGRIFFPSETAIRRRQSAGISQAGLATQDSSKYSTGSKHSNALLLHKIFGLGHGK